MVNILFSQYLHQLWVVPAKSLSSVLISSHYWQPDSTYWLSLSKKLKLRVLSPQSWVRARECGEEINPSFALLLLICLFPPRHLF